MWERWNSWTPEKGFGEAGMNSFNHYAYGAIGEWLYRTVAGIDLLDPSGRVVRNSTTRELDLSGLPRGVFFARSAGLSLRIGVLD